MEPDLPSIAKPAHKLPVSPLPTIVIGAIFFILALLLGRSMVEHRFFQGERMHENGSVGQ